MRRSRRPFVGRFIWPGRFTLSLDVAQNLAPATAGLFPGVAASPADDGNAAGDFAAMLESLAAVLGDPANALPTGPAPAVTAAEGSTPVAAAPMAAAALAGLLSGEGLPLAGDPSEGEAQVAEPSSRQAGGKASSGEGDPEVAQDTASIIDPRLVDGPLVAMALVAPQPLMTVAAPDREATPDAGLLDTGESQPPSAGRPSASFAPARLAPEPPGTLTTVQMAPATSESTPLASIDPAPEPRSRALTASPQGAEALTKGPPPATPAFALAAGVVRVTGQIISTPTDDAGAPGENGPAAVTVQDADPFQVPEPVRQGLVPPGAAPEVRPAEPRRAAAATGPARSALATAEADVEGAEPPTLAATALAPASAVRPADLSAGPIRATSGGDPLTTDETGDVLAKAPGAESQAPAAPSAAAPAQAETPEAPAAPARATSETVVALSAQMARRLDDGTTRFTLELNPGDLGRVDVRLEIDSSGSVRAAFTFEHAHSASELSRRSDELQKSLESAGFSLSGGLSFDVAGDRSQGRSPTWAEARDDRSRNAATPEPELAREGPTQIADALSGRRPSARSGVDIRI